MKVFILATTDPQHRITPVLDSMLSVRNWHMFFPGNYLIASYATVAELAAEIRGKAVDCQFVISATAGAGAVDGWAPADVWDFVNNPRDSGRHPPIVPPPLIPTPPLNPSLLGGVNTPPAPPAPPTPGLLDYFKK